jgi:hypothetical protein
VFGRMPVSRASSDCFIFRSPIKRERWFFIIKNSSCLETQEAALGALQGNCIRLKSAKTRL